MSPSSPSPSACPYCRSAPTSLYRAGQRLRGGGSRDVHRCGGCGTLFPFPRLDGGESREYVQSLYAQESADWPDPRREGYPRSRLGRFLHGLTLPAGYPVNLARLVDCLVPSRGDALDIGAFTGAFCHLLESLGFSAFGLDPSAEAVRFGRERGLRLHLGSFPDDVPEELLRRRFALISIMEAICYFRDLRESLEVVRSLLARDGRLLIKCHQGLSRFYERPGVSLFDRYGDYVQGIPTEASLRRCLESSGFRVVKVIGSESESTLPFRMGGHPAGLAGLLRSASGRILNKLHERFLSGPETADQVIVLAALP